MANKQLAKQKRRQLRTRSKIHGTAERPRLSVYRSNKSIYAQAINDDTSRTTVSVKGSTLTLKKGMTKSDLAYEVGKSIASKLITKKIKAVVFDRGMYAYKGRVKKLAEGLRDGKITV